MANYEFKCTQCNEIVNLEIPMVAYDTQNEYKHENCEGKLERHFSPENIVSIRTSSSPNR